MKTIKIFIALILMINVPTVIISTELLNSMHAIWFTPICYFNAFIGTALLFGFKGFKDRPTYIGNIDDNKTIPHINQNWAVFFISLIINLTVANLCG